MKQTVERHSSIDLDSIHVQVVRKPIKNLYIRIYSPDGRVVLSAPNRVSEKKIIEFLRSKQAWIKKCQKNILNRKTPARIDFNNGDFVLYEGKKYKLQIVENHEKISVNLCDDIIKMIVKPEFKRDIREQMIDHWYRNMLKKKIPGIINKWEKKLDLKVNDFGIRKMKTKWGSCNIRVRRIWINLELAKYPDEILEYIVVHEIFHLIEKGHNARFYSLFDCYMPEWKNYKQILKEGFS